MRRQAILLLGTMMAAVLLSCGAILAQTEDTEKSAATRRADAALDRSLRNLVAMRGGPSGVIAVVQRDRFRKVHTFGVADLRTGRRMDGDDRMRIASAAKAFSGATALSLVSDGKLSLDDTIGKRLPWLPRAWSKVTLRQLLNHTSGLPDFSKSPAFRRALLANLTEAPPPERLLLYVKNKPLEFTPGSEYRYSNSDNIAVALMVESATGKSYERKLRTEVYGPLGLNRTSLPAGVNIRSPFIHGYSTDLSDPPPEDVSKSIAAGWSWASGGVVSTPFDLNTFIRGYVKGDLFDARTQTQQRRFIAGGGSEPPGPGTNSAGLALFRYQTPCGTVYGHTGNTPGYTQFMAASPDGSRSVTVSVNEQLTPTVGTPGVFDALRSAEGRAVCAALARR